MAKKKTAKKVGARGREKTLWLVRSHGRGFYHLFDEKPFKEGRPGCWYWTDKQGNPSIATCCEDSFNYYTDKSVHLRRGGGPIKVRLVREEEA